MSASLPSRPITPAAYLLSRLAVVFMIVITLESFLTILFARAFIIPFWPIETLTTLLTGLAAGFAARGLLGSARMGLRLFTAWGAGLIGLVLLGPLSNWKMGLGPLTFWRAAPDWPGLLHLGLAMLVSIPALLAWRKRSAAVAVSPRPAVRAGRAAARKKSARREGRAAAAGAASQAAERAELVSKTGRFRRRKPKMQVSVVEEHRCPYCLEPVVPKDPRGVVECQVCHTLHHGDCWAITGACQVPHLNS